MKSNPIPQHYWNRYLIKPAEPTHKPKNERKPYKIPYLPLKIKGKAIDWLICFGIVVFVSIIEGLMEMM